MDDLGPIGQTVSIATRGLQMQRLLIATLLFAATVAGAEIDKGRAAGCVLVVRGQDVIRGECMFTPLDVDGSFQISAYDGTYFAYVTVVRKGVAEGYWNEDPHATHAHAPLGELHREVACWVNGIASVCAY
jgi:hypothetical protein